MSEARDLYKVLQVDPEADLDIIQTVYRRSLIHRSEALDEIVGAFLGVVEGIVVVGVIGVILDSYFRSAGVDVFGPIPHTWITASPSFAPS